jgi:hypothetical protein
MRADLNVRVRYGSSVAVGRWSAEFRLTPRISECSYSQANPNGSVKATFLDLSLSCYLGTSVAGSEIEVAASDGELKISFSSYV